MNEDTKSADVVTLSAGIQAISVEALSPTMVGLKNTATLPRRSAGPELNQSAAGSRPHKADQRQQLLRQAEGFHLQASRSAEQGDFETSARLILQALDCERRAGGLGPQVLQLIKPRG
jgi:hypothetical protein